jgi:hypothetical protein
MSPDDLNLIRRCLMLQALGGTLLPCLRKSCVIEIPLASVLCVDKVTER